MGRAPFSQVASLVQAEGLAAQVQPSPPLPTHLLPGWSKRSPDAPSKRPVAIEEALHFGKNALEKIVVNSVFGEVCDCRHDIINLNEVAVEDRCFCS